MIALTRTWSRWAVTALIAGLTFGIALVGEAKTVFRAKEDPRDAVQFISKAPLEKIVGLAKGARATVVVEDLNDIVSRPVKAVFTVDLASIKTGISLRDQHMRDRYLETAKYPEAVFTLKKVLAAYTMTEVGEQAVKTPVTGLKPGVTTYLDVRGTFQIHGVEREIEVKGLEVTYIPESEETKTIRPGDLLRVAGGFNVKLTDYGIKRPRMVLLRLSDDVRVEFVVVLATGIEGDEMDAMSENACGGNPCGGNPCGGNPGDANPCGGNPCGGNPGDANPCGGNPCGS